MEEGGVEGYKTTNHDYILDIFTDHGYIRYMF